MLVGSYISKCHNNDNLQPVKHIPCQTLKQLKLQ